MTAAMDWGKLIAEAREATPGPWRWEGDFPDGFCPHKSEWTDHGPDLMSGKETVGCADGYDASGFTIADADANHIARFDPTTIEKFLVLCQAVENELHHRTAGSAPATMAGVRDEMYAALNAVKEVLR